MSVKKLIKANLLQDYQQAFDILAENQVSVGDILLSFSLHFKEKLLNIDPDDEVERKFVDELYQEWIQSNADISIETEDVDDERRAYNTSRWSWFANHQYSISDLLMLFVKDLPNAPDDWWEDMEEELCPISIENDFESYAGEFSDKGDFYPCIEEFLDCGESCFQ